MHGITGRETRKYLTREFGQLRGVAWSEASQLPLTVILKRAQLHFADMSTVVTEAAWYGIPSAILNPYVKPGEKLECLFSEERETGIASVVNQAESDIEQGIETDSEAQHTKQAMEPGESVLKFLKEAVAVEGSIKHANH